MLFRTVVTTTFGMRRQTLRNSLRGLLPPGTALTGAEAEALTALRREQLSVQQFVQLTNMVAELRQ